MFIMIETSEIGYIILSYFLAILEYLKGYVMTPAIHTHTTMAKGLTFNSILYFNLHKHFLFLISHCSKCMTRTYIKVFQLDRLSNATLRLILIEPNASAREIWPDSSFEPPFFFFSFLLLIHEGSHREVYLEFQTSYDIFLRSGAKSCSDHRFRAPPAYTAQLLTLHRHRANNQYRTVQYHHTLRA